MTMLTRSMLSLTLGMLLSGRAAGAGGRPPITVSAPAPRTWALYHRFNGCPVFVTRGPVWSASQQADAEIQVGSAFYSVDTIRSTPLRTSGL